MSGQIDEAEVARIANGLSQNDRDALLDAEPAEGCEWWLNDPVDDERLAGDDFVLTPLGEAARKHLEANNAG